MGSSFHDKLPLSLCVCFNYQSDDLHVSLLAEPRISYGVQREQAPTMKLCWCPITTNHALPGLGQTGSAAERSDTCGGTITMGYNK